MAKLLLKFKTSYPKDAVVFEKYIFSMMTQEVKDHIQKYPERKSIILYGVETHACVFQTTLDLLEMGYDVHLLTDGISSMRQGDRAAALSRLQQSGAYLTTAESVIFELIRDSKSPDLKKVLPILKTDRKNQIPHL